MHPVFFEGAKEIKKPADMTDEECSSIWATYGSDILLRIFNGTLPPIPPGALAGLDQAGFPFYLTAWQPNKEDIEAINAGAPVFVKSVSVGLMPNGIVHGEPKWGGQFLMTNKQKYPIMGYAPGGYQCLCGTCRVIFMGDREAYQCEPCAVAAQAEWDALTPQEQKERIEMNAEIFRQYYDEIRNPK